VEILFGLLVLAVVRNAIPSIWMIANMHLAATSAYRLWMPGSISRRKNSMTWNKYGAKKITDPVTGYVFDSKKEYTRWCELRLLQKAGKIENLQRQVKYELIPKQDGERAVFYVADFVYDVPVHKQRLNEQGHLVFEDGYITAVEDAKGYKTEVYKIKKKLMQYVHGIKIQEV
jgi:hypothetical protein